MFGVPGAPGRLTVRELSGWWICCEAARACGGFWLPVFSSWRRADFLSSESSMSPLAPGRGEGLGVRGEVPLVRVCRNSGFSPRSAWRGWFSGVFFSPQRTQRTQRSQRSQRSQRRGCGLCLLSALLSVAWMPLPPHPRPLSPVSRGRGEYVVYLVAVKAACPPSPLEGERGWG